MSLLSILNTIISTIGVVAIFAAFLYIGRKLQVLDDLQITSNKIKANLKVVSDFLIRNHDDFNPTELQAYSPLALAQEGRDLIEKIGFDKIFVEHKKDFFDYIDAECPKLKYDAETAAIKSIYILSNKEYMNVLKEFFYNNPSRSLPNTAPTLGIYVRDEYLKDHPEIT